MTTHEVQADQARCSSLLDTPEQRYVQSAHIHNHHASYSGAQQKLSHMRVQHRHLNLVSILVCIFVPWLLFCIMYAVTSFHLFFYDLKSGNYVIAFAGLFFVFLLGRHALNASSVQSNNAMWYVLVFITSWIAWVAGLYAGVHNFHDQIEPYYNLYSLGSYQDVDPAFVRGHQVVDAGRITFKYGSHLDFSKSMSFKHNDIYCVAPIVHDKGVPESYDFWAVGVNCCSEGTTRDRKFQCGEYNNFHAGAGLRLLRDDQAPFFKLAVERAGSAYGIRSAHPLFFHWVQDPAASVDAFRWEGHRQFIRGASLYFVFQFVCVCVAVWHFYTTEKNVLT